MNFFIITGASQGFGRAVAAKLLESEQNFVLTISRSNPPLEGNNTIHFSYDLSDVSGIPHLMQKVFSFIKGEVQLVYVINNAGTVEPMGLLHNCHSEDIIRHYSVNAIAPAVISAETIRFFKNIRAKKGIINISSGVSKNVYHGWSCYCSSKASLEMLTRCVASENPNIKVITYDPGVVDTGMQAHIRAQSKASFDAIEKFLAFKAEGRLLSGTEAAEKFINVCFDTVV